MRVAFIDTHRDRWPVAVMCRAIGLSERTYHARKSRTPSARAVRDEQFKVDIDRVFKENYSCYGARRIWIALRREDVEVTPLHGRASHGRHGPARRSAGQEAPYHRC